MHTWINRGSACNCRARVFAGRGKYRVTPLLLRFHYINQTSRCGGEKRVQPIPPPPPPLLLLFLLLVVVRQQHGDWTRDVSRRRDKSWCPTSREIRLRNRRIAPPRFFVFVADTTRTAEGGGRRFLVRWNWANEVGSIVRLRSWWKPRFLTPSPPFLSSCVCVCCRREGSWIVGGEVVGKSGSSGPFVTNDEYARFFFEKSWERSRLRIFRSGMNFDEE